MSEQSIYAGKFERPSIKDPVLFDAQTASGHYRHATAKGRYENKASSHFGKERSLPVLGRAEGGSEGNLVIEEAAIDWTFRPADLQGVNDAFAVYVSGDSMAPKYKNGDLIYVHPSRPLVKGRFVLVETTEHKGFIKQFVALQDDVLVLQQFNPAEEIIIPRSDVLRVMLAIGSLDC